MCLWSEVMVDDSMGRMTMGWKSCGTSTRASLHVATVRQLRCVIRLHILSLIGPLCDAMAKQDCQNLLCVNSCSFPGHARNTLLRTRSLMKPKPIDVDAIQVTANLRSERVRRSNWDRIGWKVARGGCRHEIPVGGTIDGFRGASVQLPQ